MKLYLMVSLQGFKESQEFNKQTHNMSLKQQKCCNNNKTLSSYSSFADQFPAMYHMAQHQHQPPHQNSIMLLE